MHVIRRQGHEELASRRLMQGLTPSPIPVASANLPTWRSSEGAKIDYRKLLLSFCTLVKLSPRVFAPTTLNLADVETSCLSIPRSSDGRVHGVAAQSNIAAMDPPGTTRARWDRINQSVQ